MITVTLADHLAQAGLPWQPANGDRFVVRVDEMAGHVMWLADMTIEARRLDTGTILAFNGTTEWALDSVDAEQVVWLPREDQLRAALGEAFLGLTRDGDHWSVRYRVDGRERTASDADPETAYARALLPVLQHRAGEVSIDGQR